MAELGPSPLAAGKRVARGRGPPGIADALRPITEREAVPLLAALGRVLAEDVVSPIDVPAHEQLGHGRLRLSWRRLRAEGPTNLVVTGPTVLAGMLLAETRASGPVRAHHDWRGDARRPGHCGAPGAVPADGRPREHRCRPVATR